MTERVASDSDAVETHRAEISRLGGTRNLCLRLPESACNELNAADFVRLVIDRTERHARVEADARGLLLRGAFDNRRLARTAGAGDNRLAAWLSELDRGEGDGVAFDVVLAGELYGVREPGKRAVYVAREGPADSLASIAERLDGQ
ncbi:MAG: DUF7112 family protein [Halobacteriota archaeon]